MDNKRVSKQSVLWVATIAAFLTPFMSSSIMVALPPLSAEFRVSMAAIGWVSTSYLLAAALFLVPVGRLADIYGRRRIFLYGVAVFALSTILSALSTSATMLIVCRTVEGLGGAMIGGTSVAILTGVFPAQERGRALGIVTASTYTGLSLGPFVGGFLTQYLGWQSIFLAILPLALLLLVLTLWKLQGEWADARGEAFDLRGSFIYGLGLVCLMYGISRVASPLGAGLAVAGVLCVAAFVAWEGRVKSPVLDIALFRRNTVFALSNLAALLNYAATFAVTYLLAAYLQKGRGYGPQAAGTILVAQPVVMALLSPLSGRLSDRIEPRLLASIGMGITVAGLALLALLDLSTPIAFVIACLALLGLGFALFSAPNTSAVMGSVEKRFYSVASGTLGTMRLTGQMFSMGVAMLVFSLTIGATPESDPGYAGLLVQSARSLFALFAVLCTLGVFASLARGKMHKARATKGGR